MGLNYRQLLCVITDDVSWTDFRLLAAAIEEQAHELDHYVVFFNGSRQQCRLRKMITQVEADCYLISGQLFARAQEMGVIMISKPYDLIEEHFTCLQTDRGPVVPIHILRSTIESIKSICQ
jgi:hypothetical protein